MDKATKSSWLALIITASMSLMIGILVVESPEDRYVPPPTITRHTSDVVGATLIPHDIYGNPVANRSIDVSPQPSLAVPGQTPSIGASPATPSIDAPNLALPSTLVEHSYERPPTR